MGLGLFCVLILAVIVIYYQVEAILFQFWSICYDTSRAQRKLPVKAKNEGIPARCERDPTVKRFPHPCQIEHPPCPGWSAGRGVGDDLARRQASQIPAHQ